jgi:hypothetical protein
VGLLHENRKDYIESDLVQNLTEGNQVIIKEAEAERALKFSKNNKAAGPGGIPTELLKYGGKNVITFLMDLFNEILAGEDILQEWKFAYMYCIYKKGNKKNCNYYRGISIINSTGRLFSKVIKDKAENMIKTKISEEQAGFTTEILFS